MDGHQRIGMAALGALLLAGCAGTPPEVVLRLPEGYVIEAVDGATAEECAKLLPLIDTSVRGTLGSSNRPPRVRLGLDACPGQWEGYASSSLVVLCEFRENWTVVLAHELVHWHAVGHWTTLPVAFEEGLAGLITRGLANGLATELEAPDPEVLAEALTMGRNRWRRQAKEPHYQAGEWLVAQIGLEGLRELSRKAHARGDRMLRPGALLPPEPHEAVTVRFTQSMDRARTVGFEPAQR